MGQRMMLLRRGKLPNYSGRTADQQTESNKSSHKGLVFGLKCIYVNARSIINKIDYMRAEAKVLEPDIIGVTESWADKRIADEEIVIDGYEMFRCDRMLDIKGGGVLLYIRSSLNVSGVELKNN